MNKLAESMLEQARSNQENLHAALKNCKSKDQNVLLHILDMLTSLQIRKKTISDLEKAITENRIILDDITSIAKLLSSYIASQEPTPERKGHDDLNRNMVLTSGLFVDNFIRSNTSNYDELSEICSDVGHGYVDVQTAIFELACKTAA